MLDCIHHNLSCTTQTLCPLTTICPIYCSPQKLGTIILLSPPMNVTVSGSTSKSTHTVFVLLCLAHLTQYNTI